MLNVLRVEYFSLQNFMLFVYKHSYGLDLEPYTFIIDLELK